MKHKSNLILGGTLVAGLAVTLAAHAAVLTSALVGRWICNEGSGINALDSSAM
jgi:hypothetical protein